MDLLSPAVTIAIVTYNSSSTVIETLNSAKKQSYAPIHLIISDDCSKDNTLDVCERWLKENSSRFLTTKLITTAANTGVSGNMNRVFDATNTDYLKAIAGDDCLRPECIEMNVRFMETHPDSTVLFSRVGLIGPRKALRYFNNHFDFSFFTLSAEEQHLRLKDSNCIPAPSCFFRIRKLKERKMRYDERFPMLEDWPFWYKLTGAGIKLDYMDEVTCDYRIGGQGLTSGVISKNWPSLVERSTRLFQLLVLFDESYKQDPEAAVNVLIEQEYAMVKGIKNSYSFRIGNAILTPFRKLKYMLW